jgi:thiazole synthase
VNTAIATAGDPALMAAAFGEAVTAGRKAHLAGPGRVLEAGARASSPAEGLLTGFLSAAAAAK